MACSSAEGNKEAWQECAEEQNVQGIEIKTLMKKLKGSLPGKFVKLTVLKNTKTRH